MADKDKQLPMFGFKDNLPSVKLKKMISPERMKEAAEAYKKGDLRTSFERLRECRESLEKYCSRIKNGK